MNDPRNLIIVLLLVSATVLGVLLWSTYETPAAYGAGASVKQSFYMMTTGQWDSNTDLLYVLDVSARRLNVYVADASHNQVGMIDSTDLDHVFRQ